MSKDRNQHNNRLRDSVRAATSRGHSLRTSESVGSGHPDKICDQTSDLVVDLALKANSNARVAVETGIKDSNVMIFGELSEPSILGDVVPQVRRLLVEQIGFNRGELGLDGNTCSVSLCIGAQSAEIAQGTPDADTVDDDAQGAGDQGQMYGYATNETPELMPMALMASHRLVRALNERMAAEPELGLRPDNKAQFTFEHDFQGKPVRAAVVVCAQQHDPDLIPAELESIVRETAVMNVPEGMIDDETIFIVNGTGAFVLGGPHADAGLTGRKIIVDTYGGEGRHGGGAFSGKDPSKVDRSAAYMARYLAKQIVGNGYADKAEVQLAYCIGIAEPVSVRVDTFGTARDGTTDRDLTQMIRERFDLRPAGIIRLLGLKRIAYLPTSIYGHFGWARYPWESVHPF